MKSSINITPEQISQFLKEKGWRDISRTNEIYNYIGPEIFSEDNIRMIFPKNGNDYAWKNIRNVIIENISIIYNKTEESVLEELYSSGNLLLSKSCDIFKAMFNKGQKMSSVPLGLAKSAIDNLYALLLYSTSYELSPVAYCTSPERKAKQFVDSLTFPHTFDSSFGLGIELPVLQSENIHEKHLPFERKITKRIFSGLMDLENALEKNDIKFLLNNINDGFNANMCESLSGITRHLDKNSIMFDISLSGINTNKNIYKPIQLNADATDILKDAYYQIKESATIKDIIIEGYIKVLEDKSNYYFNVNNDPLFQNKQVTIIWKNNSQKDNKVKVLLDNEQYELAINAHRNHLLVSIKGDLVQKRNEFELINSKKIDIIQSK